MNPDFSADEFHSITQKCRRIMTEKGCYHQLNKNGFERLNPDELDIVLRCMKATDAFLDDCEKHPRLGISSGTLKRIIEEFPNMRGDINSDDHFLAVNNCLNEVCHGFEIGREEWGNWFPMPYEAVTAVYSKWLRLKGLRGGIR